MRCCCCGFTLLLNLFFFDPNGDYLLSGRKTKLNMEENDTFNITVITHLMEDKNANECMKRDAQPERSDDELEIKHFQRIVNAFRSYKLHGMRGVSGGLRFLSSLPPAQQALLHGHRCHLEAVREAIAHNHSVVKVILKDVASLFHNAQHTKVAVGCGEGVREDDMEKVRCVFRQLFREWTAEGREEREASFRPILTEIAQRFSAHSTTDSSGIQILVPGAGLGRLPYEIAKMGFSCQGNEFSLFMLFASNFVLNKCQGVDLYSIYPWVHQSCNNLKSEDQLQRVLFPDVNPSELPPDLDFSMAAGSFLEIYKTPDTWDCIATCFFIDTANNVLDYIETAWDVLKPGGYWINLGPLLYHHAENEEAIEPSYDEIRAILLQFGFRMLKEELNLPTPYSQNPRSMMSYEYRSVFFVCQKPQRP